MYPLFYVYYFVKPSLYKLNVLVLSVLIILHIHTSVVDVLILDVVVFCFTFEKGREFDPKEGSYRCRLSKDEDVRSVIHQVTRKRTKETNLQQVS